MSAMTMITGQKIVLRPYTSDDAQVIYESVQNPTLRRLTGTHQNFTLEATQRYVASYARAEDRAGWIIAQPESYKALGEVVILDINEDNRSAGIRIAMFGEEHLNKGYGSEAMCLAVDYGFRTLKLHRIELTVYDFNERAIHVYEKIGFKREGVLRDALLYDGEFHDAIIMGVLESEWPSPSSA
ncbi:MAG: GNAT family protein [bacterium]|nr:GNAT family protein [bacterium]